MDYLEIIKKEKEKLQKEGYLTKAQVNYIIRQEMLKGRVFYILTKIHKDKASWPFPDMPPGRPIFSDCGNVLPPINTMDLQTK